MSALINIHHAMLQVWSFQWLVAAATLLPALTFVIYRSPSPCPIPGIPHNTNLGLLGDLPELWRWQSQTQQVFNFYTSHFEKLDSPIVQLFVRPFRRPCVFVSDPDVTEDTLTRRGDEFDRSALFGDLLNGIVPYNHARLPTNKQMRAQRRLLSDTMSPHFLRSIIAPRTRQAVLELVDLWKRKTELAGPDCALEAYKDMQHAGLDALWAATFMTELDASRSQQDYLSRPELVIEKPSRGRVIFPKPPLPSISVFLNRILATSEEIIASPSPKQHHWVLRQFPRMRAMYRTLGAALKEAMDAAIIQASSGDADARSVAELVYRRSDAKMMPREVIRDELLGFIAAGHDPPAMTLAWGVVFLADHGDVQTRLRDDLYEAFGDQELPSADAISAAQIPYLDACIEETLRAGTSQAGVSRVTTRDTELMGYWIPK
ncbi:hypothetical protein PRZ48_009092 [Zasmidium cellare]|uniref:Cytochrome P450 n=1 Tax=Zasmidium cellare TaxID=395010 RepID=A0ABR0EHC5_ZASCE|nr:hypothetical protein PRZ48_009092 [Zasmidium cellare]